MDETIHSWADACRSGLTAMRWGVLLAPQVTALFSK